MALKNSKTCMRRKCKATPSCPESRFFWSSALNSTAQHHAAFARKMNPGSREHIIIQIDEYYDIFGCNNVSFNKYLSFLLQLPLRQGTRSNNLTMQETLIL